MSFYEALSAAVNDITTHGYDSAERVARWVVIIRAAAERSLVPEYLLEEQLSRFFGATYTRMVEHAAILKHHPGISRGTLENIKPKLRAELDRRRIMSSNLVKQNREKMLDDLDQRFTGWASSVPAGGSRAIDRGDVKDGIRKSLASLPFTERRVHVDQGHKFVANLNDIVAKDGGAIAGIWHSHWRRPGYRFRKDHKERDGVLYLIRNSWAMQKGFVQKSGALYTDEITMVGEEVYCSCFYQYVYSIQDLPNEYLSQKGRDALALAKKMVAA